MRSRRVGIGKPISRAPATTSAAAPPLSRLPASAAASAPGLSENEAQFQRWAVELALWRKWLVYHTHDSRRSEPGFPDIVLVRDRVLFRECKTNTGALRPEQVVWQNRLAQAGADVGVWRPQDRRSIELELE